MGASEDIRRAMAEEAAETGEDVCPIHKTPWRHGRNMANAPLGRSCSYDGSMHPDEFMAYLDKPGTELTPTDKNYKVYISVASEEADEMRVVVSTTRETPPEPAYGREWMTHEEAVERYPELREDYESRQRWIENTTAPSHPMRTQTNYVQVGHRGGRRESKFYFEHLSDEQRKRFVELLNAGKLNLREPGFFYRLPFFITRGEATS